MSGRRPSVIDSDRSPRVRFSVVIPCFNDGEYVFEAIDSCLKQDCSAEVEVVVVDDGSTDDWAERVRKRYQACARVQVIGQNNAGPAAARNNGVRHASGDFILFLDADDRIGRHYFSSVLDALAQVGGGRGLSLVVSPYSYFDSGEVVSTSAMRYFRAPRLVSGWRGFNRFCVLTGNCFPISSCVISRDVFAAVGGFDGSLTHHEDWDFWLKIFNLDLRVVYTDAGYDSATYIRMRRGLMSNAVAMRLSRRQVLLRHTSASPSVMLRGRGAWFCARALRVLIMVIQLGLTGRDQNLKARRE